MKIALLTFLDVANYGANLQAASTYRYLAGHGHEVWALDYKSYKTCIERSLSTWKRRLLHQPLRVQDVAHRKFVEEVIKNRISGLHTTSQVAHAILENQFDGVIIGSDAVVQHWPWFSTLRFGKHRPFWIEPMQRERRFPNPFWGKGYSDKIPSAMMSVSSQNSKYDSFSAVTLREMADLLRRMKYISVRDEWTKKMMLTAATDINVEVTPDPVFALNQNLSDIIPTENDIRKRFSLPKQYVLVGLRGQTISKSDLAILDHLFKKEGKECVAFDIEGGYSYEHPFNYQIPLPLSPVDWFALIKYSYAYIGSNMHPIVSSLTNGVPCFSIDNWGIRGAGIEVAKSSSKVYDVLSQYGLQDYWCSIENGICPCPVSEIYDRISNFPKDKVKKISELRVNTYNTMMENIISAIKA